jgi:hypothetical protein
MTYVVYGKWDHGLPIDSPALERLNVTFRPDDPKACVWIEPAEPSVLCLSFDVEATDYDDAIAQGLSALIGAAESVGLAGRAVELVAVTEEGQAVWSP